MNVSTSSSAIVARTLIVGLGETGTAAARWYARNEVPLRIADTRAEPAGLVTLKEALGGADIEFYLGCEAFPMNLLDGVDRLVLSPGLSPADSPVKELLEQARSADIEIIGEIELFARALKQLNVAQNYAPCVVGITGTNGKTTVTAWVSLMLQTAGVRARVAGNISPAALHALMDAMDQHDLPDVWVLELSSFQLETTTTLRMQAAAILNITQDHLDWHGDMESYTRAKAKIFSMSEICLVNRDDKRVMALIEQINAMNVRSFGRDQPMLAGDVGLETSHDVHWFVSAELTEFDDAFTPPVRRKKGAPAPVRQPGRLVRLMPVDALSVRGMHNALNCQVAMLLARVAGASWSPMLRAAHDYTGEPHRMAFVRSIRGIDFYNDSKGTNVGATVAGLEGLGRRSVLIAGGMGKGQDFSPLVPIVAQHAKAIILIGQDATHIRDTLAQTGVPCLLAVDMRQAVKIAFDQAAEGDAVVLSPACASYDMFRNYPHRGQVFTDEVTELALDQGEVV
jgi:UDP-N-acetylmuramoylalanine--D-glutamate ligase